MYKKILVKIFLVCLLMMVIYAASGITVSANPITEVDLASDTAWTLSIDETYSYRQIKVPGGGWDSEEQSPRISRSAVSDHVWYKRDITIPNNSPTQVTKILFGAVNYSAEIYIGSTLVASHVGVMTPFEADLTNYVTPGQTYTLYVKAYHATHWSDGSGYWKIPASFNYPNRAGGDVYNALGISRYVKLATYPQVYIKDVFVRPSVTNNNLYYDVWIDNHSSSSKTITLKGNLTPWNTGDSWPYPAISDTNVTVPANTVQKVTVGPITWGLGSTSYWWPNIPFSETYQAKLHNLNLTVMQGVTTMDTKTQRFGFRECTEGPYYYLINGVRVNHISDGTTETQIWNDMYSRIAGWLPPTGPNTGCPETLKKYMRLGINTNRMCLSMPTEYIMNTADELGFMFVNESTIDGNNQGGSAIQSYQEQAVKDLAIACRNHPSSIRYSLSNEYGARTYLIDAIVTEDNTKPLVFETNSYSQSTRINSGSYHAYATCHYTDYPKPSTSIFMMGEYAWGGADTGTYECISYKAKDMRRNDIAYMAGWSWLNYWPNFIEGVNHDKHNWAQDNHADRVDGVDGWNSPVINFTQRSFNPYLVMDNDMEDANQSYSPTWPDNVPSYSKGAAISRSIEVFNGGLSGNTMSVDWEARLGSASGSIYASGSTGSFTLEPGFHTTKTISFTAPSLDTNLFIIYKSKKGGNVLYTEDRVYCRIGTPQPLEIIIPNGAKNFFYNLYTGTRNNFTGTVGYEFTPSQDITISALGRAVSSTMNNSHSVKIWKVSDQSVVASTTVTPSSSADSAGYKYELLGSPVTLASGTTYRIASYETSGGDYWMDLATISNHNSAVTISSAVWVSGNAYPSSTAGTTNQGYVPVTFYIGGATPTGSWTTVDETNPSVTYGGTWLNWNDSNLYGGTCKYVDATNDYVQFAFTGTGVKWISSKQNNLGKADVYIDGVLDASGIDCYNSTTLYQQELYTKTGLSNGSHTIKVVVTGQKNTGSSGTNLIADAFKYMTESSGSSNFLNQLYTGSRNNFTGTVGYEFTPSQNITVTGLGRAVSTSMNNSHSVKIWRVSDQSVVAGVTVTTSSATDSLGYKYETLGSPVTLVSGTAYRIGSYETSGGDMWMDIGTISNHSSIAAINMGVWAYGDVYPSDSFGSSNQGYVPVTFYSN